MNDLDTPGRFSIAGSMNLGCQSPSTIRGASLVSQSGCALMILDMRENNLTGSFCGLTSTLNFTCWFSGCTDEYHKYNKVSTMDRKRMNVPA